MLILLNMLWIFYISYHSFYSFTNIKIRVYMSILQHRMTIQFQKEQAFQIHNSEV